MAEGGTAETGDILGPHLGSRASCLGTDRCKSKDVGGTLRRPCAIFSTRLTCTHTQMSCEEGRVSTSSPREEAQIYVLMVGVCTCRNRDLVTQIVSVPFAPSPINLYLSFPFFMSHFRFLDHYSRWSGFLPEGDQDLDAQEAWNCVALVRL